ncbi:MAG TPA: alpha/beta hydrolase family protein [Bryobacteraceae bacterium]
MGQPITRREMGMALTAATVAAPKYTGALDNVSERIDRTDFDPVHWTLERYKSAPLRLTFRANTKAEAEAWQVELRAKLTSLLGGFPDRKPLRFQTVEVRNYPGYKREKFVFESRPGVGVLGYLLTPAGKKAPHATVVCVPGHGRGVDDIVGIDEHGNDRSVKPFYEYDFAIQVVEHGMAAVAIEPMAFGCRRDERNKEKGLKQSACQPTAGSALLLGETMIGWRVWDVMRTIDWIETRPELDAKRVGCLGISGGGTCTQFSSALDLRIKAAFVSGYLNTFRDSIMSVSHCIDNYVPGILNWAENYDVASLIAPRFFFSEGGTRDPIFPMHATREAFAKVKRVYEVFGVPERAQQEIFEGVHEFHGKQGLPFLAQALG